MTKTREGGRNPRVTVEELIGEMHRTVDGLGEDGTGRADLKLLSRTLKELRYAFRFFDGLRGRPKVTVFGSARLPAGSPAYRQAESFGRAMARSGWFVVTGAGEGIMEAAHVGAGREHSIGVNILLPFEQSENTVMEGNPHLIHTKYFFTRKLLFLKESSGVVLFPGGFGTMDEAFEVLTLLQTGKTHPIPVVLVDEPGGTYWATWRRFLENSLLQSGMISARGFLPVPDHFERGGGRPGDPRLLSGVPQHAVRGPGPGDPYPEAPRPGHARRPEQGFSGSPRGGIDLPGERPSRGGGRTGDRRVCPGSFSGSTAAGKAGFAS